LFLQTTIEECNQCAQNNSEIAAFGLSLDLKGKGVKICLGQGADLRMRYMISLVPVERWQSSCYRGSQLLTVAAA
jgi:hypothetical protein